MPDCSKCENYGFIICDSNFLIYIIDFIFNNNSNTDNNFLTQLEQFLSWITECSINGKINVSKLLFDKELDTNNRLSRGRDVSLVENSHFFRRYKNFRRINYRQEVKNLIEKYINIIQLNQNNLDKIRSIVYPLFRKYTPSKKDLSLILLGLRESTNRNFKSIIVTEDIKLKIVLEKKINRLSRFINNEGNVWKTKNTISKGFISFLLLIYKDCKFNFIRELIKFYETEQNRFIRRVTNVETLQEKVRLSNSSASDIADSIILKLNKGVNISV